MGLTDVVKTLSTVASGATAVKQIHDVGKSFSDQYSGKAKSSSKAKPLTMNAEKTVKVNAPVKFWGTGTGIVSIFSESRMEREVIVDANGEWYTMLFFSEVGTYDMTARDRNQTVSTTITATK